MDRWAGKIALVTGASSGIGAQVARALAKHGMTVIAVARRLDKLNELAESIKREFKIQAYPMACDVRKEEDILKVFKWAEAKFGGVDVMINNAGVLDSDRIIEAPTESYHKIFDVNVIAAAICSRELSQSVKKRKTSGHIININSVAGHFAASIEFPVNVYTASKYALTGMSHSIRNELKAANLDIRITSISPGLVDTEMPKNINPLWKERAKKIGCLKDVDIADAVIYALQAPPHVQISELMVLPHKTN